MVCTAALPCAPRPPDICSFGTARSSTTPRVGSSAAANGGQAARAQGGSVHCTAPEAPPRVAFPSEETGTPTASRVRSSSSGGSAIADGEPARPVGNTSLSAPVAMFSITYSRLKPRQRPSPAQPTHCTRSGTAKSRA